MVRHPHRPTLLPYTTLFRSIEDLIEALEALPSWEVDAVSETVAGIVKKHALKFMKVGQPIRVALAGDTQSPSIGETLWIVGQQESVARLRNALPRFS